MRKKRDILINLILTTSVLCTFRKTTHYRARFTNLGILNLQVSSKRRSEEMPKLYNQILIDVLFKNSGPNTSKIADTPAAENDLMLVNVLVF